jgi:CRP-like cAMP-binding protein
MTVNSPVCPTTVGLLLDLDPDLGKGIGPEEWALARRACQCELIHAPAGVWDLSALGERDDLVGLLILEGMLFREAALGECYLFALLGPGDVLQPPVADAGLRLDGSTTISAAADTLVAVLGGPFILAAARWSSLLATVQRRFESQRQRLATQALIAHLPKAEDRLLLALWHLAEKWGRVTPKGTLLPLQLTHDLLGQLTGARRSTATLALLALQSEGCIRRPADGSWLLTDAARQKVLAIASATNTGRVLGETFMLRQRTASLRQAPGTPERLADRSHSSPAERPTPRKATLT